MPDYSGRYDRNGEGFSERNGLDDYGGGDSVTQHESHDHERVSSRSREKDKDKDHERVSSRSREKDRDKDKDRERVSSRSREKVRDMDKDHERGSSRSREKDKDKYRDRDTEHDKDRDRHHRDRHRDRSDTEGRHRHRSRSPLRSKSEHRSRERSRSRSRSSSKSKRISGFDMAPPQPTMLPGVAAAGQMTGTPALPGMLPNMFPVATTQFGALPIMPVQAMTQQATRHARRVYVGGLSPTANEQLEPLNRLFLLNQMPGKQHAGASSPLQLFSARLCLLLEETQLVQGAPVKVRRPSDYNPSLASALGPSTPSPNLNLAAVGLTPGSAGGLEGPDRIFVGGLPYYFTEAQIRELLESFGPLRGFDLVKDRETGNSKGYAFCVYQDLSVTDIACAALNGIKMGDKTLTVRRANQGATQPRPEQESVLLQAQQQVALQRLVFQAGSLPTKIICLTQVVSADELKDDDEYEDILDDMREEGRKYGNLVNVVIPRPNPNGEPTPGVGKVYLEYADTDGAMKARQGLNGRKFGGNTVVAVFYPENKYAEGGE
ncbi:Splicing factor U2af large subunit A [Acorus gramineus]|uniref:Splicing factor U2af large subunit n=1 Tax=Acorus gramineus TaxID=55184 RepID=A0AAV9AV39_ACOGR|nr:Splicing factor U2af large subunit A [Acorus gramineus]